MCVSCRLRRHIYDACIDFICDDSSRPTRVTTSPEMVSEEPFVASHCVWYSTAGGLGLGLELKECSIYWQSN